MYEHFSDRARKVMQLANQEAQRFNHEFIGTEHILLGLLKEGAGVAMNVLKNVGIESSTIKTEVEKILHTGPDVVTMGKLPHTPRAKNVITYTMEEARSLNHNYVGTEHLLLGLLRETEGVACQVLLNLGLTLEVARTQVALLLCQAPPQSPIADDLKKIAEAFSQWSVAPPRTKPPLGVKPASVHNRERTLELIDASIRYIEAGHMPKKAWMEELKDIIERLTVAK